MSSARPTRGWTPGPRDVGLLRWLLVAVLVAIAFVGLMWALQRRLIYLPTQQVAGAAQVITGAKDVSFETDDGLELAGWFVPAEGDPRGWVLVAQGNGGNRMLRAPLARSLSARGFSVMLFDYRGYGSNPGSPHEEGLHRDVTAARAYLESRPGVDPDRIVLFGESLGAAVVARSAVEDPPAAVVLRSPFTSLVDVARHHYPFLPVGWLLRDRYPTVDRIADLGAPVMVIAGEADRIVPYGQSRRVYEAAPEPRRIVSLPGVDHNDRQLLAGDEMISAIVAFLGDHVPTAS